MTRELQDHLAFLYGPEKAAEWQPRFIELLARHFPEKSANPSASVSREPLPLTERDAMLITYADQVTVPNEAPLKTLADFLVRQTSELVSAVHVLPFYPWTSDDGFSVQDYWQVDPRYGSWEDIAQLGKQFELMFDAVFNHCSAESEWFRGFLADNPAYRDFFVTVEGEPDLSAVVRPRALPLLTTFASASGPRAVWTTFSADQVDVDVRNPAVLLALTDILLAYVRRGCRYVRLDAIAYLWKEIGTTCIHLPPTHRVIQFWRTVLDQVAPQTMLITETNVPHRDNISYFGDARNEAQLVYNFALPPLTLHAFHAGDATVLSRWAAGLELPSDAVTFFNFLASHDGIGVNPARGLLPESEVEQLVARVLAHGGLISYKHNSDGSRSPYELNISFFDALTDPAETARDAGASVERFVAAHAILLSLRGVPGIYFHSLFGSRSDRAAADSSKINRRINRQKFALAALEAELDEPDGLRQQVFRRLGALLRARRNCTAFDPIGGQSILQVDAHLFVLHRWDRTGHVHALCVHNVSRDTVETSLTLPVPLSTWHPMSGVEAATTAVDGQLQLCISPGSHLWLGAALEKPK